MTKQNSEIRTSVADLVARAESAAPGLSGYAVKFDDVTTIGGQFDEVVSRSAFEGVDMDNVFALYNHDWNTPLAKVGKGLTLSQDEVGLRFDLDLPNTSAGRDIQELVRTGIIEGMSFGFTIAEDDWEQRDGLPLRTINRIDQLLEITVTPIPAYPTTEVGLRSLEAALGEAAPAEAEAEAVDSPKTTIAEVANTILSECPEGMELKEFLEQLASN